MLTLLRMGFLGALHGWGALWPPSIIPGKMIIFA